MTAAWHETDHDEEPTSAGRALLMAGAAAFLWGAGLIALAVAVADRLLRRSTR